MAASRSTIRRLPMEKVIKRGLRTGVSLLVPIALALASAPGVAAQERYDVDGRDVAVYNLAGTTEIVRGSGSSVIVHVQRHGDDADRLQVEVGDIGGREALRVIYPADRVVYGEMGRGSRTDVRVRSDGTFYDGGGRGGDRIEIRGSGSGMEAWADLRIEVPAGTDLSVYTAAGEMSASGIDASIHLDLGSGAADVRGVRGSVSIDTGSGRVSVSDVEGDLIVDTGSGRVDVDGFAGGRFNIDTGSGRVTARGISATSASIDTGSGSVELLDLDASDVVVDTGSGGVEVELLSDVDVLEVDTGSGSITVWCPAELGAEIELDTSSGGIDVDFPIQVFETERNYLRGSIGDGNGRIELDTGSGGIRLSRR
jgi:lia operon protein LiaG